jgi:hypothetical protein
MYQQQVLSVCVLCSCSYLSLFWNSAVTHLSCGSLPPARLRSPSTWM